MLRVMGGRCRRRVTGTARLGSGSRRWHGYDMVETYFSFTLPFLPLLTALTLFEGRTRLQGGIGSHTVLVKEGDTKKIQRRYKGGTKKIQRRYKGGTKKIQRRYKEVQKKYAYRDTPKR